MGKYLLRRLVISVPVLLGITLVVYVVVSLAPGDPVDAMVNPEMVASLGPEYLAQQREALGLNQPILVRYGIWLKEVLQGNLGFSFMDRQPISAKILERLWPTLRLMLAAQIIAIIIAIPIGVMSALKQYSLLDYAATILGFAAISVPSFFLSLAGIYIFALKLPLLPAAGMVTVGQDPTLTDALWHLILPAFVLGLAEAAPLIRYTRSSMLEVIRQDYVRTAQAKGLHDRTVIYQHALRNALIPLVTVIGLQFGYILGGAVVVETVFTWPGVGLFTIQAITNRDYPVVQAAVLILSTAVVIINLLVDLLYGLLDPRIRIRG